MQLRGTDWKGNRRRGRGANRIEPPGVFTFEYKRKLEERTALIEPLCERGGQRRDCKSTRPILAQERNLLAGQKEGVKRTGGEAHPLLSGEIPAK